MTDVMLIQPPQSSRIPEDDVVYTSFPLGLAYMAAVLEERGFGARIIDMDVERLNSEALTDVIRNERPKVIGLSVMTHTLNSTYNIVEAIGGKTDAEIVVGGPHITAVPETVRDMKLKYGFAGEAELSFADFCDYIIRGEGQASGIPGLVINDSGKLKGNGIAIVEELDSLPFPAWHLLNMERYRFFSVLASRGCPFNCIYCMNTFLNRKRRARRPENVIDEIRLALKEYGDRIRDIDFVDDVFTIDRKNVLDICRLFEKKDVKVEWNCTTRADLVDLNLLGVMKSAGCKIISFGIESGSERIRNEIGRKNISNEDIENAFLACDDVGIKTRAYVMFGHPTETIDDMRESVEFVRKLKPTYAVFLQTLLAPKTELFDLAVREGKADRNIWRENMRGNAPLQVYLPENVSQKDVEELLDASYARVFLEWEYILKRMIHAQTLDDFGEALRFARMKAGLLGSREGGDD